MIEIKVLIFTVTVGKGHNQVADSIKKYYSNKNIFCKIIDIFGYVNRNFQRYLSNGYLFSTKYLSNLYGKLYGRVEKNGERIDIIFKITNIFLAQKIIGCMLENSPDVVIYTHVFAAQFVTEIFKASKSFLGGKIYDTINFKVGQKQKRNLERKNIESLFKRIINVGVITDFTIHPYWENVLVDYYVVASEQFENCAKKRGIEAQKIKPFGIPIDVKFTKILDKKIARDMIGIEDKRTALITTGGAGYGEVLKSIKEIVCSSQDFQIVVVCGLNEKLKKRIEKLECSKKIYIKGFVDNMEVFMDASDFIIAKPGGVTTSESLSKGLPMIIISPIPGHEDRNTEFLLNNGAAIKTSKTFPIDEAIYQLFTNERRFKAMKEASLGLAKPNSTRDLCDFLEELCVVENDLLKNDCS
ncbi:MAG: glycosyltransferase [Clostridiales bacterium]|nr:glycosyltransferase [Clostridiales bacterium]